MKLKELSIGGMSCFEELDDLLSVDIIEDHIIAMTSRNNSNIYIARDTGNSYFTLLKVEEIDSEEDSTAFFLQSEEEFAEYCKDWV